MLLVENSLIEHSDTIPFLRLSLVPKYPSIEPHYFVLYSWKPQAKMVGFNPALLWKTPEINPINHKARSLPLLNPINVHGRVFFFSWFGFMIAFWSWYVSRCIFASPSPSVRARKC